REAVVRLEGDRLPRLDLEHRVEIGPERPDHLVAREAVRRRDGRHAGSGDAEASGATVSSSTYTRSTSRRRCGASLTTRTVKASPSPAQPIATQFAYLNG